jgi:mono/diheme cytochrome c family protein
MSVIDVEGGVSVYSFVSRIYDRFPMVCVLLTTVFLFCPSSFASAASQAKLVAARERGRQIFQAHGCEHCHGANGSGGRAPDLSNIGRRWSKRRIRHQITVGGKSMPGFADVLSRDQINDLVIMLEFQRASKK